MATKRRSVGRVRANQFPNIPVLRRGVRIFLGWTFCGVGAGILYVLIVLYVVKRPILASASSAPFAIFQTIGAVRWVRWSRRVRANAREFQGRVCLHCLYPLIGLGGQQHGSCPECGKAYDLANVEKEWAAFIAAS